MSNQHHKITSFLADTVTGLKAIYLFGSRAKGEAGPDSDYDIAILTNKPQKKCLCFELSQELGNLLGADVDLIDLGLASTVFRSQILSNSERLYSDNSFEVDNFEAFVYSDYARLNEERFGILKDIEKSGQVYGR